MRPLTPDGIQNHEPMWPAAPSTTVAEPDCATRVRSRSRLADQKVVTMPPLFSRASLLGASSAIALVGLPLLRTFVEAAQQAAPEDIESLNSAIELERAGIKAYADAAATGLLSAPILKVATNFMADHTAHRDALIAAVTAGGATPSAATAHLEYPRLASSDDVLEFAMTVERKAASTYLSVIPDFRDRRLAQIAASILGVEATHVTTLAAALGTPRSYPSGFVS